MTDTAPSPDRFFAAQHAFHLTAALNAAIDLDLFTAVGEGADSVEAIAKRCQASTRGTRILSDFLVIHEFLTKTDGRYGLTKDSAVFLDRRSPAYVGSAARFLSALADTQAYRNLAEVVRSGHSQLPGDGMVNPDNPLWVEFARSMAPLMHLPAQLIAEKVVGEPGPRRVLDIAAGHGLFGIALAKRYPQAEVVAVDWSAVLDVALENARGAGVESRYRTITGDAFEVDLGSGYDLALLTNFLHHFDPAVCQRLLARVHGALAPGGRALALEFVPNADRVSPAPAAAFSLVMLASTPAGDAYTYAELDAMFRAAGFARTELVPLPPTMEQVVIATR